MKIKSDILAIISAGQFDGPNFRLPGQLDRKVYQDVAKVVEAAGGKWVRAAKAIVFDQDAAAALEPLLLTGEVTRAKQDFVQFDTPPALAALIVGFAEIKPGMFVLEPSCGIGMLVLEIEEDGGKVAAFEIDARRRGVAQERCTLAGGIYAEDFLLAEPNPIYDAVVMNPPFAKRADIHHVLHAKKFLRKHGRLTAIMSAGVAFRQDALATAFRQMVDGLHGTINPLPEGSFKKSGTDVNTVLVQFHAP